VPRHARIQFSRLEGVSGFFLRHHGVIVFLGGLNLGRNELNRRANGTFRGDNAGLQAAAKVVEDAGTGGAAAVQVAVAAVVQGVGATRRIRRLATVRCGILWTVLHSRPLASFQSLHRRDYKNISWHVTACI